MSRSMPNTMSRSFTCGRCSTTFQSFDGLQRHVDEMRHFRCMARFCQKDFDSRQELLAHRSACRPPPPPPLTAAPVVDSPYPIAPMNVDIYARRERVLKLSQRADAYSPQGKNRFVYMDTDNIIFSMLNSPHLHPLVGAQFSNALRLHFDKFTQRVCQSAKGAKSPYVKMLSASYFGAAQVLAQSLVRFGWSVVKREGITETDIDAMVAQRREPSNDNHNHKRTLVLVTGDAKVNHRHGSSFRAIALKYLNDGWNVEIHAWAHSIHESFIQLMDQFPTQCLVRLIDDSDDISALVYAGSYNPWQQAPVVAMLAHALPSPVFHSQPPSPSHSMASPAHSVATEFDFDPSAPAVVRSQLHQQEQLTAELQLANSSLAEKVRALEAQLAYERAANQQLVERLGDATSDSHARVVPTATPWARHTKAVRSTS